LPTPSAPRATPGTQRTAAPDDEPFWKHKTLSEMTRTEWESLCDGCGKCCLLKLQDIETDVVEYTNVACRLLDDETCRCTRYTERQRYVPDCVVLSPDNIAQLSWMPSTCAYRLIAEGRALPIWHHLVSGSRNTVNMAGHSVRGRTIAEADAPDPELHIVRWPR
jgi:uncharacterized cysteine cluster protein YcgN (CxxCxxCC family)